MFRRWTADRRGDMLSVVVFVVFLAFVLGLGCDAAFAAVISFGSDRWVCCLLFACYLAEAASPKPRYSYSTVLVPLKSG